MENTHSLQDRAFRKSVLAVINHRFAEDPKMAYFRIDLPDGTYIALCNGSVAGQVEEGKTWTVVKTATIPGQEETIFTPKQVITERMGFCFFDDAFNEFLKRVKEVDQAS